MDLDRLLALFRALHDHRVEYVLVGGVAVNLHGLVRATEDVDLFLRPEPENIERVRSALRSVWDDPALDEVTAEDLCGDYPTVRYGPPDEDFVVDLLTRLGTAWRYDDLEAESVEHDGTVIRLATPTTLFRMKRGTVRPIDHADAQALARAFDLPEDEA